MTDQPRPPSSARRLFSMTILVSEVFVVLFAVLVVVGLRLVPAGAAWAGAAALTVLLVTAAGLLRTRAGYLLGWVAQLALLAVSVTVPTMLVLTGVFVVMWAVAQRVGGRVDRERRERHAAELAARVEP
ncbi:MAG: DUF4233 domain-containing protein [Actinobacteria bacterium]|nr:DUF4233 domain-containing protein [Actinomycetota bacterium]